MACAGCGVSAAAAAAAAGSAAAAAAAGDRGKTFDARLLDGERSSERISRKADRVNCIIV